MRRKRRVIAISALKGGVGKTTSAVNLAAAASRAGRAVLLVDLDPQGSVSSALGLDSGPGLDDWLRGAAAFSSLVRPEVRPGLDVVPAGPELVDAEDELREKAKEKRRHRLERRLASEELPPYDAVLLDCPPSATLLLENAYVAADELIVPAKLDYLSLPALDHTTAFAKGLAKDRDHPLKIDGVLPTFYDLRAHVSEDVLTAIRERFAKILSPIRINACLAEAPAQGKTIYDFDASARGAVDYSLLAEELGLA